MNSAAWSIVIQLFACGCIGWGIFASNRAISRKSKFVGGVVSFVILIKALVGLVLFAVSYWRLPLFRSLQLSPGFWLLAVDAENYYNLAVDAAHRGLSTINPDRASPAYVATLALWLRLVGESPAAGFFLNLTAFTIFARILASWFNLSERGDRLSCAALIVMVGCAPSLLIHGSQSLKDDLFLYSVGVVCLALATLLPRLVKLSALRSAVSLLGPFLVVGGPIYWIAGARTYYDLLILASCAAVMALTPLWSHHARSCRYVIACLLTFGGFWCIYLAGAGSIHEGIIRQGLDGAREGFATSPGATNFVNRLASNVTSSSATDFLNEPAVGLQKPSGEFSLREALRHTRRRLRAIAIGCAMMFVPISALRTLSVVNFSGGRGLLFITDVDTSFLLSSLVVVVVLLWRNRDLLRSQVSFVFTLLCLGLMSTLVTAYVVTNFGSLFRLRMTAILPFWMLLLATRRWADDSDQAL